jgi:hypothetical protein
MLGYKMPIHRERPYIPPINCRLCGGTHESWAALEACRERHTLYPVKNLKGPRR